MNPVVGRIAVVVVLGSALSCGPRDIATSMFLLGILSDSNLIEESADWSEYSERAEDQEGEVFERNGMIGRPLVSDAIVKRSDRKLEREILKFWGHTL